MKEKCEKLEKEKSELIAKMEGGEFVDLGTLHQVKQDKHKLQKEVVLSPTHYHYLLVSLKKLLSLSKLAENEARLSEMEKKVKDAEDKNKKSDRILKENKDRINDLEKEVFYTHTNILRSRLFKYYFLLIFSF